MGKVSSYPNSNPIPNDNYPRKKQKKVNHHTGGANGRCNNTNGELPVVMQTASDDGYSFNQTSTSRNGANFGGFMNYKVASYSKSELKELKKGLRLELERVKDFRVLIESGQLKNAGYPRSQTKMKKLNADQRLVSGVVGSSVDAFARNEFDVALDVDPVEIDDLFKECGKIVMKLGKQKNGHWFKAPVDVEGLGLLDYHQIVKKPMDLGTVKSKLAKNVYPTPVEFADDVRLTFNNALLYNPLHDPVNLVANQMLSKFEVLFRPVQEKFDSIVSQCREKKLSIERELSQFRAVSEHNELQGSSWNNNGFSGNIHRKPNQKVKSSPVLTSQAVKKPDRVQATTMQAHSSASTPSNPPQAMMNQQQSMLPEPLPPNLPIKEQKVGRTGPVKQPKPRAKDPNKREMTLDEKQMLGLGLQSLPQEKMPQLIQIIRKRNGNLAQDGDEIELEIETLDTETLWELDRFVTNWKKMVSKNKRQSLMMMNNNMGGGSGVFDPPNPDRDSYMGAASDKNEEDVMEKKFKDNDEEDVDIDDDMPETSFVPVEIEKDEAMVGVVGGSQEHDVNYDDHDRNHDNNDDRDHGREDRGNPSSSSSSSGSSSSGSSSSSDSDSGSSSGSDSDADDAQS